MVVSLFKGRNFLMNHNYFPIRSLNLFVCHRLHIYYITHTPIIFRFVKCHLQHTTIIYHDRMRIKNFNNHHKMKNYFKYRREIFFYYSLPVISVFVQNLQFSFLTSGRRQKFVKWQKCLGWLCSVGILIEVKNRKILYSENDKQQGWEGNYIVHFFQFYTTNRPCSPLKQLSR